jgi:uncharacterized membrane protein
MIVIRYLALAALVVWVGGMVILGLLVAPQTFRILQASNPVEGRMLAGALFGAILRQFHLVAFACGAVLLVCLFVMKFSGPPPHTFVPRAALVVIMLALTLYSAVPVTRQLAQVQSQVSGPVSQLPKEDPRRVLFDRLHRTSTILMTINMGLGLVLLHWYVRE